MKSVKLQLLVTRLAAGLCVLLGLVVAETLATSIADPERHDVFSPNGVYVLDINPETETHTIYRSSDRSAPLWSFSKPVWHYPFLVSNDGTVVVTLAWRYVPVDDLDAVDCIQFRNGKGVFRTYSFREICPAPARTSFVGLGPIGDFWRTWYTGLKQGGADFSVTTTDLYAYRFDTSSGDLIERRIVWGNLLYKPSCWLIAAGTLVLAVLAAVTLLRRRRSSVPERIIHTQSRRHGARE